MTDALKPCPFCGMAAMEKLITVADEQYHGVMCQEHTQWITVYQWNHRSPDMALRSLDAALLSQPAAAGVSEERSAQQQLNAIVDYIMGYWPISFAYVNPMQAIQVMVWRMVKAERALAAAQATIAGDGKVIDEYRGRLAAAERRLEQEQNFKYNANKRAEVAEARALEAEKVLLSVAQDDCPRPVLDNPSIKACIEGGKCGCYWATCDVMKAAIARGEQGRK
jgi:hypothetical protein